MLTEHDQKTYYCPFLKWAGGKTRLIPKYIRNFLPDNFQRYYEPFLGGGALFFYLTNPPFSIKTSYLTDINEELINTYKCIKTRVDEVILILKEHEKLHNESAKNCKINLTINHNSKQRNLYYYKIRDNKIYDRDVERAARFIYLNKTCFNGLYRVNSQGKFNVPLGRYENPKICQEDLLQSASKALSSCLIQQADFTEVLNHANSSDDFVYFDPPYYPISKTSYFTAYSEHSFREKDPEKDQLRLRDTCKELASCGVKVMVSNSASQFIKDIYGEINFKIHPIQAARSINSNIENRGRISELLITSY